MSKYTEITFNDTTGKIVNLTPHAITIDGHGTIQPSGEVARVSTERTEAPAEQGEPVGYVRPHHLEMLRSGKVCGVTMEDRPDERNGVTVPLYAAAPALQGEPVGWQFYQDGKWWNGDDRIKDHRKNTEEAGYPIRDVYVAPHPVEQQPTPDVEALVEALEAVVAYDESAEDDHGCLMMHYGDMMAKVSAALKCLHP